MEDGNQQQTGGLKSMTGFGRATDESGKSGITVTVRSVNHRNLEQSYRLPERLWEIESILRARVAESLSRGKVDVSVRSAVQAEATDVRIDEDLVRNLIAGLTGVAAENDLQFEPKIETLLRVPGVVTVGAVVEDLGQGERETILRLLDEAVERVVAMRVREGEALQKDISDRIQLIRKMVDDVVASRERLVLEQTNAMRRRITELAATLDTEVAEDRLAAEIAIMAEKLDIAEETTRLASHIDQMEDLLGPGEPVGRKLDFLCQEMTREVNTIGSKSKSSALKSTVIEFKAEIERVREQVQNVE